MVFYSFYKPFENSSSWKSQINLYICQKYQLYSWTFIIISEKAKLVKDLHLSTCSLVSFAHVTLSIILTLLMLNTSKILDNSTLLHVWRYSSVSFACVPLLTRIFCSCAATHPYLLHVSLGSPVLRNPVRPWLWQCLCLARVMTTSPAKMSSSWSSDTQSTYMQRW